MSITLNISILNIQPQPTTTVTNCPFAMSAPKKLPSLLAQQQGVEYRHECKNRHECLKAIRQILDGEATFEQITHFQANIDHCLPCIESHNLEITVRQLLCDRIEKKAVPQELIANIRAQILNGAVDK